MKYSLPVISFLIACTPAENSTSGGSPRSSSCQTRSDCAGGKVCGVDKYCTDCTTSGQCAVKEICAEETHSCVLREGWGTQCAMNEDCQAGAFCKQGLCKPRSEVHLCLDAAKAQCPQGMRCHKVTRVCEEDLGCTADDDCSPIERCNRGKRACVPRCTEATQSEVCAAEERCADNICVQCVESAECGAGFECDSAGRCSAPERCYTDRDCQVPLVCFTQTGACLPKAPPCLNDDACKDAQRCDIVSGRCISRMCQQDIYEPNDEAAQAFHVTAQAYRDLTLCLNDTDWYAITLSRGDKLGVILDADVYAEDTFTTAVKGANGRTLASGKLLANHVAAASAIYNVTISSTSAFQTYDVTFLKSRGVPCDDDAFEPNDTSTQPTALNASSALDGKICPQDQDWFSMTVPAARGVRVSLTNYDSRRGVLRLCLYAADGMTQNACASAPTPAVSASMETVAGLKLLLRVLAENSRVENPYTVEVEWL